MIKTVIIEDIPHTRDMIQSILSQDRPDIQVIGEAENVTDGLAVIAATQPELVFMDIRLTDGTAFDLLEKLPQITFKIIFITAFEDYAIKAFKFSALDYIVKPIRSAELVKAVQKFPARQEQDDIRVKIMAYLDNIKSNTARKKIVLKSMERIMVLDIDEIVRCESQSNYTLFYLTNGQKIIDSKTLKEFDDLLSDLNFLRVHNSHLINLTHLRSFEKVGGAHIRMDDGSMVPVSKRKKDRLIQILGDL